MKLITESLGACRLRSGIPSLIAFSAALTLVLSGCNGVNIDTHDDAMDDVTDDPTTHQPLAFQSPVSTVRFLTQSTFGPTPTDLDTLPGTSASQWFQDQLTLPVSLTMPDLRARQALLEDKDIPDDAEIWLEIESPTFSFWNQAVGAPDQLRQRMAWALSQIFVVSNKGGEALLDYPETMTYYQDLLIKHAFGNYRELLEAITYSPAMGFYLTYAGNQKADPVTGQTPDENYARELLQLFSVGIVQLHPNGQPVLDSDGNPVELYTNEDIKGLAKVFTGLDRTQLDEEADDYVAGWHTPMVVYPEHQSLAEKRFLNTTIPAGTPTDVSIDMALDALASHPNTGPLLARQLIQRLVTSNPSPAYIARVAHAFDEGDYALPNGDWVGDGRRGDLAATLAAILFDEEARAPRYASQPGYGKVREPVIRIANWARAFEIELALADVVPQLHYTASADMLKQHPYRAPSVFNFYRPGYVPSGTESGEQGLTVPEMQITHATTISGYINFLAWMLERDDEDINLEPMWESEDESEPVFFDEDDYARAFNPNLDPLIEMAADPTALVDYLDLLLTANQLSSETRSALMAVLDQVDDTYPEEPSDFHNLERAKIAIWLIMTSPDYLVQR